MRLDEVSLPDRKRLGHNPGEFLGQNDRNGARIACINRDRKRTGVAVVTVNGPIGFPHTISMAGWVVIIANKENFRPKTAFQTVLCFDYSQIIASGDHAAVEHDQIVLARGEKDRLLRAGG